MAATAPNFTDAILQGALQGATLEVRTRLAPPFSVDLASLVTPGAPGAFATIAQPVYTLRRGSQVILRSAPAGEPSPDAWKWTLGVLAVVMVGVVVASIALSRKG